MRFAKIDQDRVVVAIAEGECHGDGWLPYPKDAPSLSLMKVRALDDGSFVQTDESILAPPTYAQKRSAAYPSIGDQLDALWKALGPTLDHPAAESMMARIKAVKDANPKT